MNLLELTFQRKTAKRAAQDLLDKAMAESLTLTTSEQVRFDSLAVRIQELDAAISQRESLRKVAF